MEDQKTISLNLARISETLCHFHKDLSAEYICTQADCINQNICFLCELCFDNHTSNHLHQKDIISTHSIFSTRLLKKTKAVVRAQEIELNQDKNFQEVKTQISDAFIKLEAKLVSMIKEYLDQAQKNIQGVIDPIKFEYEKTLKIISEYEKSLSNIFLKDDLPEFKTFIFEYLKTYQNLTDALQSNFTVKSQKKISIQDSINLTNRIINKSDDLCIEIDHFIKQKMLFFQDDVFSDAKNLMERLNNLKLHKTIPKTDTNTSYKMIFNGDFSKYMTNALDFSIIARNTANDNVLQTLKGHTGDVYHIIILADGRLVSTSADSTLKIWNIETEKCVQTLLGHSSAVYCSFQLTDSVLISGSGDKTLKIWNLQEKSNTLNPKHTIQNNNLNWCIGSIKHNEFAASSSNDINIFTFDLKQNNFEITRILKGHTGLVRDIKIVKSTKDVLLSCSDDKTVRLWDIFQNGSTLLKIFSGHTSYVFSLLIISDEIFISGGSAGELIVWNINQNERVYKIDDKQIENMDIWSICKASKDSFACCGSKQNIYHFTY